MTTKTSKTSLNSFDDKRIYVSSIKSYPHDENLCLYKTDQLKKIDNAPHELLLKLDLDKDKDLAIIYIKELFFNEPREIILAAITPYNDFP